MLNNYLSWKKNKINVISFAFRLKRVSKLFSKAANISKKYRFSVTGLCFTYHRGVAFNSQLFLAITFIFAVSFSSFVLHVSVFLKVSSILDNYYTFPNLLNMFSAYHLRL